MVKIGWSLMLGLLLGLMSSSRTSAEETDFDASWKEAVQNVKSGSGQQYFNDVFLKEFAGKYTVHVNECTRRTGERVAFDLRGVMELGASGQVLAVKVRPESKVSTCFADLVKRDTFSKPPSDHFWIPVEVRPTNP